MAEPVLLVDRSDPRVAVLTLNRPDRRNALSIELMEALGRAFVAASADSGRRAVILLGAGPVFCAGLDFKEAQEASNSHRSANALASLYKSMCACPLVTIAAAHGSAFGGGAGLLAACDLAIGTEDLQLGYPEVRRGLVAALVSCLLRRQVPGRRLREMLLLGQTLAAGEALHAGLLNRVVAAESLLDEARLLAAAVMDCAPGAIARTKRLLDELDGLEADMARALDIHLHARDAGEAAEGISAFFEKRKPNWAAARPSGL